MIYCPRTKRLFVKDVVVDLNTSDCFPEFPKAPRKPRDERRSKKTRSNMWRKWREDS